MDETFKPLNLFTLKHKQSKVLIAIVGLFFLITTVYRYSQEGKSSLIDFDGLSNITAAPSVYTNGSENAKKFGDKTQLDPEYNFSFLMLPLYSLGSIISTVFGAQEFGITKSHLWFYYLANLFFALLSLYLITKTLKRFYQQKVVNISIILLALGTNIFIYTTQLIGFSNIFLAFLISAFFYLLFLPKNRLNHVKLSFLLSSVYALIVAINPAHFLLFIIPLFRHQWKGRAFRETIKNFFSNWTYTALPIITIWAIFILNQLYLVEVTDIISHFHFSKPHIDRALFDYRKGWLIYTPIMIFGLIGLFMAFKKRRFEGLVSWEVFAYLIFFLFLSFSYWNWWYSSSFGQRVMIDTYLIFTLGIAEFVHWIFSRKSFVIRFWAVVLGGFFLYLNIFQSWQFKEGILSKDGMTQRLYWASFGETEGLSIFQCLERKPNYQIARESGEVAVINECDGQFWLYLKWLTSFDDSGTNSNAYDVVKFKEGHNPTVYYDRKQKHTSIGISLGADDTYELSYYRWNQLLVIDTLESDEGVTGVLESYAYILESDVQEGFDKIEIRPISGDGDYSIGHIVFY